MKPSVVRVVTQSYPFNTGSSGIGAKFVSLVYTNLVFSSPVACPRPAPFKGRVSTTRRREFTTSHGAGVDERKGPEGCPTTEFWDLHGPAIFYGPAHVSTYY